MNDDVRERAVAALRRADEALLSFVQELIRIPSHAPEDCAAAADAVEQRLVDLGLACDRHDVPGADGGIRPTLLVWLGAACSNPVLLLNSHLDTSPPGPGWTIDPYGGVRRDGRVYGRGAVVAKSDVASYIHALAAVRDAIGDAPSQSAVVAITSDEGSGGALGVGYLLETLGLRPRNVITAGFTYRVGVAHSGALQARLRVTGRAVHQAVVAPADDAMRLAVLLAAGIVDAGEELARRPSTPGIARPTLNITRIEGGAGWGMAPSVVELLIDRRVCADEQLEATRQELEELVASLAHAHGAHVTTRFDALVEPLRPTEAQRRWAAVVAANAEQVLGRDIPLAGIPLYTDARLFGAHGIPTVLYGAGGDDLGRIGINGADEYVEEDEVLRSAEVITRVVVDLLVEETADVSSREQRNGSER